MPTINMQAFEESRRHQVVQKYEVYPLNTSDINNYQIELTEMASSIKEDARVVQNGLLDQWTESKGNVWSKLINLKAKTPQIILGLSGNPSSKDIDDGNATFKFFDDFSIGPYDPWVRYFGNPIIPAPSSDWDYGFQVKPSAIYQGGEYKLYYYGAINDPNNVPRKIGLATSNDGYSFTKKGIVFNPSASGWDSQSVLDPTIMYYNSEYWLYYGGQNLNDATVTGNASTGLAKSSNGTSFTRITNGISGTSKVLDRGAGGEWDHTVVLPGSCVYYNGELWLYYWGRPLNVNDNISIGLAKSSDGVNFTKITNGIDNTSKVLTTDGTSAEGKGVMRASVFRYDNKWHMFYIRIHTDNSKRIGYAYSTNGIDWTRSLYNPVLNIGTADWENDYIPGVSVIFKEGNNNNKCIMYYQGAYIVSKPTNQLAIADQYIVHDWDGGACKWTFSNTNAITIEDGVTKVKAVAGGQNAYVCNKPTLGDNFVQEFNYKPTSGYTYYGVTSIGVMQQNSYAGGNNVIGIWHYGGTASGNQKFYWRSIVDASAENGTSIQPYNTNELYKFQAKKLGSIVICKIWDTSHSEANPNVNNTLTAKNGYEFPYIAVFTRPSYTQPSTEIDNYRIREYADNEPIISIINNLNRASLIKVLGSRL